MTERPDTLNILDRDRQERYYWLENTWLGEPAREKLASIESLSNREKLDILLGLNQNSKQSLVDQVTKIDSKERLIRFQFVGFLGWYPMMDRSSQAMLVVDTPPRFRGLYNNVDLEARLSSFSSRAPAWGIDKSRMRQSPRDTRVGELVLFDMASPRRRSRPDQSYVYYWSQDERLLKLPATEVG